MVNRRSSQVERQGFKAFGQVADKVPDLPLDSGAAAASVEKSFNALEGTFNTDADRLAKQEGRQEGFEAGMADGAKPRRDGTLRGGAFDEALASTAIARLDTEFRRGALDLADKHEADPQSLQKALTDFKSQLYNKPEYQNFLGDAEIRRGFELGASRIEVGLVNHAGDKQSAAVKDQNVAARYGQIDEIRRTIDRLVSGAGDDPTRLAAAQLEFDKLKSLRAGMVRDRLIHATAAEQQNLADDYTFKTNALIGQLGNLKTIEDVQNWSASIEADFKAGRGIAGQLDGKGLDEVLKRADTVMRRMDVQSRTVSATVTRELESVERRAAKGMTINPGELNIIEQMASGNPVAQSAVADTKGAIEDLNNWRRQRPDELELTVEGLRRKAQGQGSSERDYKRLERAQALRDLVGKRIADNPLQWATEVGLAQIEPIDPSSPESFKASMGKRIAQADAVKNYYKLDDAPVFTSAERSQLTTALGKDGNAMLSLSRSLNEAVGPARAVKIMKEIAPSDPAVGFAGGLLQAGGSPRLATNAVEYNRLEAEGAKLIRPDATTFEGVYRQTVGGALRGAPATDGAIREVVQRAYAVEGRGKWDGKVDTPEEKKRLKELLDQSVGAVTINGERYGGFDTVNSARTVVPASVAARRFNALIRGAGEKDIDDQPFHDTSGRVLPATMLGNATLVAVGNNQYEVYFGDPASGNAKPALTKNGETYRLDWNKLEAKLRNRYPADYFRSVK